jgi:hypothetical protein
MALVPYSGCSMAGYATMKAASAVTWGTLRGGERLTGDDTAIAQTFYELVRQADVTWGQIYNSRPHFQQPGNRLIPTTNTPTSRCEKL